MPKTKAFGLTIFSCLTFFVLNLPYIFDGAFVEMVFKSAEQGRSFLLNFPYYFKNNSLLLAPAAYLILFLRFAVYKRMNQDMFILILGLVFSVLVVLVPPQPGWFFGLCRFWRIFISR